MIRIYATCTTCRQQAAVGPEHTRDTALDLLDCLGWTDLSSWPLCPDCASWENAS